MDNIKKALTKEYQVPFKINESLISMILGVLVVLLVGLIAYNYFRTHREVVPTTTPTKTVAVVVQPQNQPKVTENKPAPIAMPKNEAVQQKIGQGQSAVALPATHKVVAGESLWTIAEQYYKSGYNYVDIAKVNNLANANVLTVGQQLTIPKVEVRQPLTIANATTPVITQSRITGNSYMVVKGDSIWEISVRAYGDGYQYQKIVMANHLTNPSLIFSGNKLTIPR